MGVGELREQLQSTLGDSYAIERELGGGGMSRVFVAQERSLGRDIVVKVLPPDMAAAVSIGRFKREIAVAARLQHPHIVPVLFAGDTDGLPFYAMPFVKGESLRSRLTRERELGITEAIRILRDVAAALAHAHGEGVVHRDIKPENVMLSGGVAVVTDFGVAKAVDASSTHDAGTSPGTTGITSLGVALGTPNYMAPEQASGDPAIDHRADLYAFGTVAYEMLAGSAPFAGRPTQQVLAAQVTETPVPLATRRPNVPGALAALVMRCLEKRPGDRPQSANEILHALDTIITPSGGTEPTAAQLRNVSRARHFWPAVAVAALVVIAALTWTILSRGSRPPTVGATRQITISPEAEVDAALSPDGQLVAYAAGALGEMRVYVRQVAGGRAVPLAEGDPRDQRFPAWSPDGSQLAYTSGGTLMIAPALGGTPRVLLEPNDGDRLFAPAWSPDGRTIAYAQSDGIYARDLSGGVPRKVVAMSDVFSPSWSPDGQRLAFASGNARYLGADGVSLLNRSPSVIWTVSARGGTPVRITPGTSMDVSPIWLPEGRSLMFISDAGGARDIYVQRLRSDGSAAGQPERLTTGLSPFAISMSADGRRVAYSTFVIGSEIRVAPLRPDGAVAYADSRPFLRENIGLEQFAISNDGAWMAYDATRHGNADLYKQAVAGGEPIQLTSDPADDFAPYWSSDDRRITFHSWRAGNRDIFIMDADGRNVQQLTSWPSHEYALGWGPDNRHLLLISDSTGQNEVYRMDEGADGRWSVPHRLTSIGTRLTGGWSPDGRWVAFATREGNLALVPAAGGAPRVLVNTAKDGAIADRVLFGTSPGLLYYTTMNRSGSSTLWSIDYRGGVPKAVLTLDASQRPRRSEITTDGKRMYFMVAADQADLWYMELKP